MDSYYLKKSLILLVWALAVIGSGVFIVRKRKSELNLIAYSIYCLGCICALAMLFSGLVLLMFGFWSNGPVLVAWLLAGAIGGAVSWRWWNANRTVAAASAGATGPGPAGASPAPPILNLSERAIALAWFGGGVVTIFLMAIMFDGNDWLLIAALTDTNCGESSYASVCYADAESGMVFGAFLAAVTGSILFFGRRTRLGTIEQWIYKAGVGLSLATMVLFWIAGTEGW